MTKKIPLLLVVQFLFLLLFLFFILFLRTVLFCLLCTVFSACVYCNFLSPCKGYILLYYQLYCWVFLKGVAWRGENLEAKLKACSLWEKAGISGISYRSPSCTIRLYKTKICLIRVSYGGKVLIMSCLD